MADPIVLLVAPATSGGAALRERLQSLGFRCDLIDASGAPRGWMDARADVIVVMETGTFGSPASMLLSRRPGTTLEELPVIALGPPPPRGAAESAGVDETIPEDADDAHLAERLRVWARWGRRLVRLRELETAVTEHQETDPLTGLPGHRPFHERLETEVGRSVRYGSAVSVLIGDVESMRTVNERYGHRTGDRVLREVGQTLRRALRQVDFIARYEGDRFGIVLAESRREGASLVAARLRSLVGSLIFRGESTSGSPLPLLKIAILFGEASLPDASLRGKSALLAAAEKDLSGLKTARATPTVTA